MPTSTITSGLICRAVGTSNYATSSTNIAAGSAFGDDFASAIRFEIPTSSATSIINQATLTFRNLYHDEGFSPNTKLGVKPGAQDLPGDASSMQGTSIYGLFLTLGSAGGVDVSVSSGIPIDDLDTDIDVTEIVEEAREAGLLDDGYICFVWKNNGTTGVCYADANGSGHQFPSLYLSYTDGSLVVATEGELSIPVEDILFEAEGYLPTHFGTLEIPVEDILFEMTGNPVITGQLNIPVTDIVLSMFGSLPIYGELNIVVEDIGLYLADQLEGSLNIPVEDVLVSMQGTNAILGSLSITVDSILLAMQGESTPQFNRTLFPEGLFPSGLLVG